MSDSSNINELCLKIITCHAHGIFILIAYMISEGLDKPGFSWLEFHHMGLDEHTSKALGLQFHACLKYDFVNMHKYKNLMNQSSNNF